jgi:MoaA/NifB/PqqE/SkfB family radical SAM enzyme
MKSLQFHALVLETIDRCNARCAMCYQAAGPRGSDLRGDANLPLDLAFRVIDEAAELPELVPRLHISGGEAFLRYQDTLAMFRHGKSRGFANIGTTTNGFWAGNRETAERRCRELSDSGVTYFEVSMDYWHLPYVSLNRVRNLLWAARRVGITVILRTLSTRSHHADELFASFSDEELMHVMIAICRVHPVGRAASEIPPDEIYYGQGAIGCCENLLTLTVAPNGNVYPCCAGADMTESLASGNVYQDTLAEAVFKMRTDRTIRHVIHAGTGSLIPLIQKLGYGDRLQAQYSSICHLCWDIFKDNELAGALRNHFQEEQLEEMIHLLQGTSVTEVTNAVSSP